MFVHRKQGLFLSVYVDDIKMAGKKQNLAPMWEEIDDITLIFTNQHHCLTMYFWYVLDVNADQRKQLLNNVRRCLNHVFLPEQLKNCQGGKTSRKNSHVVLRTWKDMLENALSDTVNW